MAYFIRNLSETIYVIMWHIRLHYTKYELIHDAGGYVERRWIDISIQFDKKSAHKDGE